MYRNPRFQQNPLVLEIIEFLRRAHFTAGLIANRDLTPPERRHFICQIDERQTRIFNPNLRRWNTYGDILALRDHLVNELASRVIVVSADWSGPYF